MITKSVLWAYPELSQEDLYSLLQVSSLISLVHTVITAFMLFLPPTCEHPLVMKTYLPACL